MRPSYLYDGNPYTGKTISFYWDGPHMARPLDPKVVSLKDNWTDYTELTSRSRQNNHDLATCAIYYTEIVLIWFKYHWNLLPKFQWRSIGSDNGIRSYKQQAIIEPMLF